MNRHHVYPVGDLVPHETEGVGCPCGPWIEWLDEGCVVIHKAWDEREKEAAGLEEVR